MVDYILLEEYAKKITVLFVEDDENIRKEVYDLLTGIFPHVNIAVDGEDGFKKYIEYYDANKKYYDLIITDIKMPKLDGIELTRMIYEKYKEQSLLVLSAHSDSKYLIELVNMGIAQFITKPIEINNFVRVIYNISKDIHFKNNEKKDVQTNILNLNSNAVWNQELKRLTINEKDIKLSKKEILIIDFLLQVTEKTRTVEELIAYVWEDEKYNSPDVKNLNNIIARLRKKIPEVDIENVYGFGFKINIY